MMLLLPFFGFSQQEDPRRVSMVINLKEINPEQEIIQLPATNLPIMAKVSLYRSHKAISSPTKKNNQYSRSIIKETFASKSQNIAVAKIKPTNKTSNVATNPIPPKKVETTVKTTVIASKAPQKSDIKKDSNPNITSTPTANHTNVNKGAKKTEEVITSQKIKTDTSKVLEVTHGSNVNSFSYIWIGIFLIAAGIVLGLLFGKPAFLVSFVGVVFILLGLIIQSK